MDKRRYKVSRDTLATWLGENILVLSRSKGTCDTSENANFLYLTGIDEPGWQLVVDGKQQKTYLIAPDVDDIVRVFDGGLSFDEARDISGVDIIVDDKAGRELLREASKHHEEVYTVPTSSSGDVANKRLKQYFSKVKKCSKDLARTRAIKRPEEIALMKEAADLTVAALEDVKTKLGQHEYEYQVEADIAHHFRWHNATHAFEPIVASGKNACTLHYCKNTSQVAQGNLLLIDVGARSSSYVADITRTFAVGKATKRQAAIHAAVRVAQEEIIDLIRPGYSITEYVQAADGIMKKALTSVGLMKNPKDEKGLRRYFPHAVSHGLGLEVHESLGGYKEFMPGMVLTVEPGIYIPEEGIGVRIEDDILVTAAGHENLTARISTDL